MFGLANDSLKAIINIFFRYVCDFSASPVNFTSDVASGFPFVVVGKTKARHNS